jgi:hypothetical protein
LLLALALLLKWVASWEIVWLYFGVGVAGFAAIRAGAALGWAGFKRGQNLYILMAVLVIPFAKLPDGWQQTSVLALLAMLALGWAIDR